MSDWRDEAGKQPEPDKFDRRRKVVAEQLARAEFSAHHDMVMALVAQTSTPLDIAAKSAQS